MLLSKLISRVQYCLDSIPSLSLRMSEKKPLIKLSPPMSWICTCTLSKRRTKVIFQSTSWGSMLATPNRISDQSWARSLAWCSRTCTLQIDNNLRTREFQRKPTVFQLLLDNLKLLSDFQRPLPRWDLTWWFDQTTLKKLTDFSKFLLWTQLQVDFPTVHPLTPQQNWCQWSPRLRKPSKEEWPSVPRYHIQSSNKKWWWGSTTPEQSTSPSSLWWDQVISSTKKAERSCIESLDTTHDC